MFSKDQVGDPTPEYQPRALLSPKGLATFETLCQVVGKDSTVLAKVSLAELVKVPNSDRRYLTHWRRVQRRTLDFLICSALSLKPYLAIKLETDSESKKRRANGPDVIKQVLGDIELPLLYLRANEEHGAKDLAKKITFLLQERQEEKPAPEPEVEESESTTTTTLTRAAGPVANIWTAAKEKYYKRKPA